MNRAIAAVAGIVGLWFLLLAGPRSFGEAVVKYVLAVVLLVFAYRRWRTSPKKMAQYTTRREGAAFRLDVTPAAAPVNWFAAVLSVGLAGATVGSGLAFFWVAGLLIVGLLALLLLSDARGRVATRPQSIGLSPEGIELDGQLLRKGEIHHLAIRNKFAGDAEIVYDAGRGIPTGTLAGLAHRRKLARVAYRVEAESGGKAHAVAAGLDEVTARGIVGEIRKALDIPG